MMQISPLCSLKWLTPPHGARTVPAGRQEVGVSHMIQPGMSPDLNPVEQVWDQLKQRLDGTTPSSHPAELHVAISGLLDRSKASQMFPLPLFE